MSDQTTLTVNDGKKLPEFHRFSREAMATTFEIYIAQGQADYARQAAHDAFGLLVQLEGQLSRFIENSDISRLNGAPVNEPVILGLHAFSILERAKVLYDMTEGALDVTIGGLTARHLEQDNQPYRSQLTSMPTELGMEYLVLDEEAVDARRLSQNVKIDLGAIGKGYALDTLAERLTEWGITRAMVHGGGSTALALDSPDGFAGWPVTISCPFKTEKVVAELHLRHLALSGSAHTHHSHIVNPRSGELVTARLATWSCCPDATTADGLSTALMIMSLDQLRTLSEKRPRLGLAITEKGGEHCLIQAYGSWPGVDAGTWCRCDV